jgi:putative ABC transport system substrate-binding protein
VIIKQMAPGVKSVGTLYNSGEANSRKVMSVARDLFQKHGIRLEEVSINNSNEAHQAAQVLCQKGIDVLWVTGDNTAVLALDAIAQVTAKARLPLVINAVDFLEKGAVVACGIGFEKSGYEGGVLAARVLLGEKPSQIPFQEIARKRVGVNFHAAQKLGIAFPAPILREAELFVGLRARRGRPARVAMVQIVENPTMASACDGVVKALQEAKLKENEDFVLKRYNAAGESSQLPLIMSAIKTEGADLIVTAGTPTLLAAVQATQSIPIVFTVASDPEALGIFSDDRPLNVTGVYDDPPVDRLLALALKREPACKMVGTVWDPSQPNSEISVKKLRQACQDQGVPLAESTAGMLTELTDATLSLCVRGADVIIISADNLTTTGFPAILGAGQRHHVPIYTTDPSLVASGAAAAIGDDHFEWGRQSGRLAARVLGGASPASLPAEPTAVQRVVVAKEE